MWILGSLDASFRRDEEIKSVSQIRFIVNKKGYMDKNDASSVSELEELDYQHWFESIGKKESFHMPWALINAAVDCSDTPIVILCTFVLEGENSREAFQLTEAALHVCKLEQEQPGKPVALKAPPSWAGSHVPPPHGYLLR